MKTRIVAILMLAGAAAGFAPAAAFAHPAMGRGMYSERLPIEHAYLSAELDSLLSGEGQLGSLSYAELRDAAGRLSVARQKDRFVARSRAMSFMLPGSGQFLNKDYGSGAAFLASDLAVVAGTLIGSYWLLPENLRFQQLDYFNTSFTDIENKWKGHTFTDYLPSMAVLAGGGVLRAILGHVSSEHAARLAKRNIDSGKITFEPSLLALPGGLLMGMGWRY
jgi:hypothetical protein